MSYNANKRNVTLKKVKTTLIFWLIGLGHFSFKTDSVGQYCKQKCINAKEFLQWVSSNRVNYT